MVLCQQPLAKISFLNIVLGVTMEYGLFLMPSHPPEREVFEAHQWDLDCLVLADKLGFSEAWIGEHYTALWEPPVA